MGSAVDEMQQKVRDNVPMPAGYFVRWGGEFENQQRAMKRLTVIVPLSVSMASRRCTICSEVWPSGAVNRCWTTLPSARISTTPRMLICLVN